MATLFEEARINGMQVRNRLVRSATWEGMCGPDGSPTPQLVELYRALAQGGIGLLVTGYAFVRPEGKALPHQMGIHSDHLEPAYREMIDAVHAAGARVVVQIAHSGGQCASAISGFPSMAPTAMKLDLYPETPAEVSREEIGAIVSAFRDAARRAKAWGADGVQLHAGHGYLFSQFLSPLTNRRTDDYGGSFENRSRFVLEVYGAMRDAVGADFPIMAKLGLCDNLPGGLEVAEGLLVAQKMAAVGFDALEVSSGTMVSGERNPCRQGINSPEKEAYHLDLARQVKKVAACPVITVGGFRSFEVARRTVEDVGIDFVALSRPLVKEPDLPRRWQEGDHGTAECVSCNGCYLPGLDKGGIRCVI